MNKLLNIFQKFAPRRKIKNYYWIITQDSLYSYYSLRFLSSKPKVGGNGFQGNRKDSEEVRGVKKVDWLIKGIFWGGGFQIGARTNGVVKRSEGIVGNIFEWGMRLGRGGGLKSGWC